MPIHAVNNATQARLGAVVVNRMELGPPPLRIFFGSIVLVLAGALLGTFGNSMAFGVRGDARTPGLVCLGIGAVLLAAGIAGLVRGRSCRYALTVHEQGILVSRWGTEQAIAYSQVQGFSLKEKEQLYNGLHEGTLCTLRFAWPGGSRRILHLATVRTEQSFAAVLQLLLGGLADAAKDRLSAGGSLMGKGWMLDSHGLHVQGQKPVPLGELASMGLLEGKVSLWRAGEELPFLSVPAESLNARLLGTMARRQLSSRERPTAGTLGRLLFQKGLGQWGQVACWILAAFFLLCAGGLGIVGIAARQLWIAVLAPVMAFLAWRAANGAVSRLRVYERGGTKRWFNGTRQLLYSELCGFQFGMTRHYHNTVYQGTSVSLGFIPKLGVKAITYDQTVKGGDSDFELLREEVSRMVAARLLEQVQRGAQFSWGPTARFTKQGLVIRDKLLFGESEPRLVHYSPSLRVSIQGGTCSLFMGKDSEPVMSVPCSAYNFYPGLKMLEVLVHEGSNARAAV